MGRLLWLTSLALASCAGSSPDKDETAAERLSDSSARITLAEGDTLIMTGSDTTFMVKHGGAYQTVRAPSDSGQHIGLENPTHLDSIKRAKTQDKK